eukprot:11156463-Alexandrium_andersonii.AAC.1
MPAGSRRKPEARRGRREVLLSRRMQSAGSMSAPACPLGRGAHAACADDWPTTPTIPPPRATAVPD